MKPLPMLLLLFVQIACVSSPRLLVGKADQEQASSAFFVNRLETRARQDYIASGCGGMIASAHPEASRIGAEILQEGGNAIDAMVAASFAISVLRPQSTGIGGGGFMLLYRPKHSVIAYDFRERAPSRATRDMFIDEAGHLKKYYYQGHLIPDASVNGPLAVGTPGLVAGLLKAHAEHGTMPLERLIRPAIKLAQEGFLVYADLAEAIKERQNILGIFEDSRRLFLPNNVALKVGQTLKQSDLAWTLEQIAKRGAQGFYEGAVADKILAEIARGHGILSREDLKNYQVKMREPLRGTYRGYRIVSMSPPSSGGVHVIEMLNMLSNFDIKSMGRFSTQTWHLLAEVMKRAFADRAQYLGDPDFTAIPTQMLLSKNHATSWVNGISLKQATKAKDLVKSNKAAPGESPTTTHISVVDGNGVAISTTQTINYSFGSGVVARGTGIVLNDEMDDFAIKPDTPNVYGLVGTDANAIAANKTMLSSMSPTMVFKPDGELLLVLGSPGGPKIINATWQTIVNVIDFGMSLPDAVHSSRIHHQWIPDIISFEPNLFSDKQKRELEKMGHELKEVKSIGDVQAIQISKKNGRQTLLGVSDTRSSGQPKGLGCE